MIFGNVNHLNEFSYLEDSVKKCFEYAKANALISFEKGSHPIDGDNLFVNIVEYETTTPENRFWEAHKDYLDVHLMLNGEEQIDINFIGNMTQKEYVPKDDFLPLEGTANCHVTMQNGDFLICYPNDGHMTAIKVHEPKTIKKAIFKVRIK